MDDILVVQMARMGDFLQTTPLICGIKNSYPSSRLRVLVDESIHDVAAHCPFVDEILTIDTNKIYNRISDENDVAAQYSCLRDEFAFLREMCFDMTVNVNFSILTAAISTMPKSSKVFGYSICPEKKQLKKDPWFVFLNSNVKHLPLSPFNLVDYFYYLCGPVSAHPKHLSFFLDTSEKNNALRMLSMENVQEENILIAFQVGTRHEQRQWPVSYFSELALMLLQHKDVHIILLGTEDDIERSEEFKQHIKALSPLHLRRIHDFINKTGISELAGLLENSDLLVSCDTGAIHMAAAVGCRVLALFFGPAFVCNTGPYGPEHWMIQTKDDCSPCVEDESPCSEYSCRYAIKPDTVFSLLKQIVFMDKDNIYLTPAKGIEVFKSRFDSWGIVYDPLSESQVTVNDIQNLCYREMGKKLIDKDYKLNCSDIEYSKYTFDNNSILKMQIEQILKQGQSLIHKFYSAPVEISRARLEKSLSFWHPWIDYYWEVKRSAPDYNADFDFLYGMHTGTEAIKSVIENYN